MLDKIKHLELKRKYPREKVYVIPFTQLKSIPDKFTPITTDKQKKFVKSLNHAGTFIPRYDAEYNPVLQQIIPYILVMNETGNKLYVTKRVAGDKRLVDSYALGCGGHINPIDIKTPDILMNAAEREMNEELKIQLSPYNDKLEIIGFIRDLASSTNEHTGIVMLAMANKVSVREKKSLKGEWMTIGELVQHYQKFESWARHIIDYLFLNTNNGRQDKICLKK